LNLLLEKASVQDAETLLSMQVMAFMPLLEKYQDYDVNPATETIERTMERITNPNGGFYKIVLEQELVGAICISHRDGYEWISPMFILPEYQGMGIGQSVILELEAIFHRSKVWQLATIQEEARNCHLYEKMGYVRTGMVKKINDSATLIYYKKVIE
jgi:GNAT superfamily N-acetyltransferase